MLAANPAASCEIKEEKFKVRQMFLMHWKIWQYPLSTFQTLPPLTITITSLHHIALVKKLCKAAAAIFFARKTCCRTNKDQSKNLLKNKLSCITECVKYTIQHLLHLKKNFEKQMQMWNIFSGLELKSTNRTCAFVFEYSYLCICKCAKHKQNMCFINQPI